MDKPELTAEQQLRKILDAEYKQNQISFEALQSGAIPVWEFLGMTEEEFIEKHQPR